MLVFILCCAAVVLGMEANFAKLLPYDSDFIIFGLVVSCVTVLFALAGFLRSTPAGDSICFFIFGVLWVAMGGFSVYVSKTKPHSTIPDKVSLAIG